MTTATKSNSTPEHTLKLWDATGNAMDLDFQKFETFQDAMNAAKKDDQDRLRNQIEYIGEGSAKSKIARMDRRAEYWCTINGVVHYLHVARGGLRILNEVNISFSAMSSAPFKVIQFSYSGDKAGIRRFIRDSGEFQKGSPVLLKKDLEMRASYVRAGLTVTTACFS